MHLKTSSAPSGHPINVGIQFLRILLCFFVVVIHYQDPAKLFGLRADLYPMAFSAVPVFLILSFYFLKPKKLAKDPAYRKKRADRLLWPQIFWTLAYCVVFYFLERLTGVDLYHGPADLFWQFFFGCGYNATAWYQVVLIWMTVLVFLLFCLPGERTALFCLGGLSVLSLVLSYSGLLGNFSHIMKNAPPVIWGAPFYPGYILDPIGRFAETLPYVFLGLLLGQTDLLNRMKKNRWSSLLFGGLLAVSFFLHRFLPQPEGFCYGGIWLILMALFFVLFFWCLPFEKLPEKICWWIKKISDCSMGVYFIHRMIGVAIYVTPLRLLLHMQDGTLHDCAVVCLASFIVTALLSLIPSRRLREALS